MSPEKHLVAVPTDGISPTGTAPVNGGALDAVVSATRNQDDGTAPAPTSRAFSTKRLQQVLSDLITVLAWTPDLPVPQMAPEWAAVRAQVGSFVTLQQFQNTFDALCSHYYAQSPPGSTHRDALVTYWRTGTRLVNREYANLDAAVRVRDEDRTAPVIERPWLTKVALMWKPAQEPAPPSSTLCFSRAVPAADMLPETADTFLINVVPTSTSSTAIEPLANLTPMHAKDAPAADPFAERPARWTDYGPFASFAPAADTSDATLSESTTALAWAVAAARRSAAVDDTDRDAAMDVDVSIADSTREAQAMLLQSPAAAGELLELAHLGRALGEDSVADASTSSSSVSDAASTSDSLAAISIEMQRLADLQDHRLASSTPMTITPEERVQAHLVASMLARVLIAHNLSPRDMSATHRTLIAQLTATHPAQFAGTLPVHRPFAFPSNAAVRAAPRGAALQDPAFRIPAYVPGMVERRALAALAELAAAENHAAATAAAAAAAAAAARGLPDDPSKSTIAVLRPPAQSAAQANAGASAPSLPRSGSAVTFHAASPAPQGPPGMARTPSHSAAAARMHAAAATRQPSVHTPLQVQQQYQQQQPQQQQQPNVHPAAMAQYQAMIAAAAAAAAAAGQQPPKAQPQQQQQRVTRSASSVVQPGTPYPPTAYAGHHTLPPPQSQQQAMATPTHQQQQAMHMHMLNAAAAAAAAGYQQGTPTPGSPYPGTQGTPSFQGGAGPVAAAAAMARMTPQQQQQVYLAMAAAARGGTPGAPPPGYGHASGAR
ncbi:hypothetical protein GGF31_006318 [Allomyces arbusculus]|nr:hypothetical protein GGF31_006318 [Allomyces arbusculus]